MQKSRKLIFDIQILQTPALERGMGQYISSLLIYLDKLSKDNATEIYLIYSNGSKKNKKEVAGFLASLNNCTPVVLPLVDASSTGNTKKAMQHNKDVLDGWLESSGLEGSTFILGSAFQAEIYPVFPSKAKKALIVYDVIPIQMFDKYKNKMKWSDYISRFTQIYDADKLLCISNTTANDLQIYCSVDPSKISVINGGPGELNGVKAPKNVPKNKFILMPTGNDLRKNNKNAILGFEHYRLRSSSDLTLVVTSYFSKEEQRNLQRLSQNITFTGSIPNDELTWFYKNCEALLFPSIYEGLGMPIIEAMLFDKPVVASGIEAFTEISPDLPYYFNPHESISIAEVLESALEDSDFDDRRRRYGEITKEYTWANTAKGVLQVADIVVPEEAKKKPRIAVAGPYPNGVSAIGKFISVLHPFLQKKFNIDYYFESSPIDKELRPNILEFVASQNNIRALTNKKIREYDAVIYHIGNSNHHTVTAARALLHPGIVIVHDLNFENIYKDMLERRIIDNKRCEIELWLNDDHPAKFAYSIVSRQKAVITHSTYANKVVRHLVDDDRVLVKTAQLCVDTPKHYQNASKDVFTIGLAGILANIKGLETIEKIASDGRFQHDKILVFGLNFAEKGVLDRLRELPNIEIATDLTDYEFQQNIKRMSVFVNYRTSYQGEASYSTLETMRYGIPVIVRGDFGWYSELPEGSVIKVSHEGEIMDKIQKLKLDPAYAESISANARKVTASIYSQQQYVDVMSELINQLSKGRG